MANPSRRRVNYTQLEILWEFMDRNRDIAMGYNKTAQAREYSRRMWMEVSNTLNSLGDGATKNWKGWCKYWNDYKSKLKRMAVAARSSHRQTGGGPSGVKLMTDIEKKFLTILGPDFGEGLAGMRVEPFEESSANALMEESMPILEITPPAVQPSTEEPGPSWRVSLPLPQVTQAETPTSLTASALSAATPPPATPPPPPPPSAIQQTTPRRSLRHRRLGREPHMSQDAARRALVRLSEEKVEIAQQQNVLLGALVTELREIKEILRSR